MTSMLDEFKKFAMRGNVMDLAVGVIIGGAFGKIVSSLVDDVIMPPIGLLLGRVDFSNLYINLSGQPYASLAQAKAAGAATLNYGLFINAVLNFTIVAFAVFLLIKQLNRLAPQQAPAEATPASRECPYCLQSVPVKASRCCHCTSHLEIAEAA